MILRAWERALDSVIMWATRMDKRCHRLNPRKRGVDYLGKTTIVLSGREKGGQEITIDEDTGAAVEAGSGMGNEGTGSIGIDQEVESGNNIIGADMMIAHGEGKEVAVQRSETADIEAEALIEDITHGGTTRIPGIIITAIEWLEKVVHLIHVAEKKKIKADGVDLLKFTYRVPWDGV